MTITTSGSNELTIDDTIKSIDDCIALKEAVNTLLAAGNRSLTLRITNSFSLPSAVIGFLMKLVRQDRIVLTLLTGDHRLYELLEELQLVELFGVRPL